MSPRKWWVRLSDEEREYYTDLLGLTLFLAVFYLLSQFAPFREWEGLF